MRLRVTTVEPREWFGTEERREAELQLGHTTLSLHSNDFHGWLHLSQIERHEHESGRLRDGLLLLKVFAVEGQSETCAVCGAQLETVFACPSCGQSFLQTLIYDRPEKMSFNARDKDLQSFAMVLLQTMERKAWETPTAPALFGVGQVIEVSERERERTKTDIAEASRDLQRLKERADVLLGLLKRAGLAEERPTRQVDVAADQQQELLYDLLDFLSSLTNFLRTTDDLWCAWNRRRGHALVGPDLFLTLLERVQEHGFRVLHLQTRSVCSPAYRPERVIETLKGASEFALSKKISAVEAARILDLDLYLTTQLLDHLCGTHMIWIDQDTWSKQYYLDVVSDLQRIDLELDNLSR